MNPYIGKRLGSYQILEQIGQGGMATIFKAYQASVDRYVALKILPSHFTEDESFVGRFTQEARTLARLEHPHILPVHDYGEQEGITYLVMRYIDAGTLKDLIAKRGPMELSEAARILRQVGRALDYAHSQGVVHRDIKPTNVLIDERGDAFLTDFGIAKLVAGTAQFTATGAIVGTPAYMSPEQGMADPVDHRSDIYSLGVVLYEMVTGRVPFEAETPLAVLLKHINAPMPPPRQIKPDLPEEVERVILKSMAKSPDDRFQTADEMVEAFQGTLAGSPTETALPLPVVPLPEQPRLEPTVAAPAREDLPSGPSLTTKPWLLLAGGAAVLVVVLVAALLILPNLGGGETPARETPTDGRVIAEVTNETASTPTVPPATAEPVATSTVLPVATVASGGVEAPWPPGWTNYNNGNHVLALVRQDDFLWAGSQGGLVRWDLEDGSYVKFGVPDGLVSSRVNDLLVDAAGVLWVATDAGINRFDSQNWLAFDETDGLDTEWVQTLFLDPDGALWAGTAYGERGLNYYDGAAWGVPPPIPPLPLDFVSISAFALFEDEGLFFAGLFEQGLGFFEEEEWVVVTGDDILPSHLVYDLLLTVDSLWISFEYGVARIDKESGDLETIPPLESVGVYAMHEASDGSMWFGGEGGAVRYDPEVGDWQEFESGSDSIPSWAVTDIIEDERGLWLSTYDGGVVFYDGTSWETWATDDELGGNDVEAILGDGTGALWFLHAGLGLTRYDPINDDWETFGEEEGALNWPSVPAVDSNGDLWIGGYGELKRYDGRTWQSFTPAQLADLSIYNIAFGAGGDEVAWLWTDVGLMHRDPATDEWTTFTGADHPALEEVNTLYVASDGTAWVGTAAGVIRYDKGGWGTPAPNDGAPEYVSNIAEAPDGSLWVVGDGDLYHLDGDRWTRFVWPGDGWIERVAVGPDGTVWAGHDGLARFDPLSGEWQIFTPADGLIHNVVQAIHVTPDGVVWVGTPGGISRYVPEE